jgi:quercetin 2,3-dioxygenase
VQLDPGKKVDHRLGEGRYAWVQVTRGAVKVSGNELKAGDGAALSQEKMVELTGAQDGGEVLLFDLA